MVDIVVDTASLHRYESGSIIGRVFLRGATGSFPEERWSDFPVVVLSWWIDGLRELVSRQSNSFQGLFMDGPFSFVVESGANGSGYIAWGRQGTETAVEIVNVETLLKSAVEAGRLIVHSCRERNWSCIDVENLEHAIARSAA
jgi:hypothetical protein